MKNPSLFSAISISRRCYGRNSADQSYPSNLAPRSSLPCARPSLLSSGNLLIFAGKMNSFLRCIIWTKKRTWKRNIIMQTDINQRTNERRTNGRREGGREEGRKEGSMGWFVQQINISLYSFHLENLIMTISFLFSWLTLYWQHNIICLTTLKTPHSDHAVLSSQFSLALSEVNQDPKRTKQLHISRIHKPYFFWYSCLE